MTATDYAISTARLAALAAQDRHGESIIAFDVSENLAITDIFLVVSASNERTVGAIVDAVERKLRDEANLKPVRREGDRENRWVLLDYLDVVVHVQHSEERETYSLERLWRDSPTIDLHLPEQGPVGADEDSDLDEGVSDEDRGSDEGRVAL
ncbi:ribosome silencing factor [Tessaracoccus sp. SD287]|uniref:ribosome silencing factor n=1 Tax=Tessaracoccus sp. SD287 TaxID=2782008 RepID=UPI001A96BC60|nr:ribosome silencing factor [Tessaracoccus sp. SD287]MBO1031861.1 ribosome silencing factor [Tessaracoccus sp. SD287]